MPIQDALERCFGGRDEIRRSEARRKGTSLHPYKAAPGDTRLVAATLPWATELLAAPDQLTLTEGLRPMIERSREVRRSQVRRTGADFHLEGALELALSRILSFRAPLRHTVGHLAPAGTGSYRTFRTAHVPHLIWQEDYDRDFRPLVDGSGVGEKAARIAISVALVRLTGTHTHADALRLLGLQGMHRGASLAVLITHLKRVGREQAFQQALHALATRLEGDGPHMDYRAAQGKLKGLVILDRELWLNLGEAAGVDVSPRKAQRRNAAAWVWASLLSSDPYRSPALTAGNRESLVQVYSVFCQQHLSALEPALLEVLRHFEGQL